MYKPSKKGKPSVPIIVALMCLIVQYFYDLSDTALEDALINRLIFPAVCRHTESIKEQH